MCNEPLIRVNPAILDKGRGGLPPLLLYKLRNRFKNVRHLFLERDDPIFLQLQEVAPDFIQFVPCHKCAGCRADWSAQWTARCLLESRKYQSNLFVTLTYDDEHLPYAIDYETGEVREALCQRDFQLFMKRLRKWCAKTGRPSPRYFYCGEYGTTTHRPHFHAIIFNLELDDLRIFFHGKGKLRRPHAFPGSKPYYISKQLADIWGNGHVLIAACDYGTIKYTANYQLKQTELKGVYPVDPFARRSTRPGLARDYYEENLREIYTADDFPSGLKLRVKHIRYFDSLLKLMWPDIYEQVLERRIAIAKAMNFGDDRPYLEQLDAREAIMQARQRLKSRD